MKIIDLSRSIDKGMCVFPNHPGVEIDQCATIRQHGRNLEKITMCTHCGTHIDAPYHFLSEGDTVDKISLSTLIGEALIINLCFKKRGDIITREDLSPCEKGIAKYKKVIIYTGWPEQGDAYYKGHPILDLDCCEYLISMGVDMIAMDLPSPALSVKGNELIHGFLMRDNISIIEGLVNLDKITNDHIFLVCLPLKIMNTGGAPARVVAIDFETN